MRSVEDSGLGTTRGARAACATAGATCATRRPASATRRAPTGRAHCPAGRTATGRLAVAARFGAALRRRAIALGHGLAIGAHARLAIGLGFRTELVAARAIAASRAVSGGTE